MGPQGNVLRGESLVLVVSASPHRESRTGKDAGSLTAEDWVTRIEEQIVLHLELRFNKARFARKATADLFAEKRDVEKVSKRSRQIRLVIDQWIRVTKCPIVDSGLKTTNHCKNKCFAELEKRPRLLVLVGVEGEEIKPEPTHRKRMWEAGRDEEAFVRRSKPYSLPCSYEFFHLKDSSRPTDVGSSDSEPSLAGQLVTGKDAGTGLRGLSPNDDDLYHLASRVCGALTEYTRAFDCGDESPDGCGSKCRHQVVGRAKVVTVGDRSPTCQCIPLPPIDVVGTRKAKSISREPWACVPKILDVRDAVNLLCEGLDGSERFFPPIPRGLQRIFQGSDNTTRTVAARYKFPFGVWFRGQSRVCQTLTPSLFHEMEQAVVHDGCCKQSCPRTMFDETTMVNHFMSHKPLLRHDYIDHFEWLCLMQHHSAPTRVLDWSENILIALYFAVCDTTADCDGVVWALNAGRLNEITRVSESHRYACFPGSTDIVLRSAMAVSRTGAELRRTLLKLGKLEEVQDAVKDRYFWEWTEGYPTRHLSPTWHKLAAPVAVFPTRVNEREEDQLATFTVYGGKVYDREVQSIGEDERFDRPLGLVELSRRRREIPPDNIRHDWDGRQWTPTGKPFLDAFLVPSCAKRKLREQLKRLGVHVGALFPELEHQAKYIRHQWRFEYQSPETQGKG